MTFEVINPAARQASPTSNAAVLDVASSATIQTALNQEAHLLATAAKTDGVYGLFHYEVRPGQPSSNLHLHTKMTEAFFVLEGTPTLYNGNNWQRYSPGSLLHVPEQAVHGFYNDSDDIAKMLILSIPGIPREQFFSELNEILTSGHTLTQDEWNEFYAKHDQYMVREAG